MGNKKNSLAYLKIDDSSKRLADEELNADDYY